MEKSGKNDRGSSSFITPSIRVKTGSGWGVGDLPPSMKDSRLKSAFQSASPCSAEREMFSVHEADVVRVCESKQRPLEDGKVAKDVVVRLLMIQLRLPQFPQKGFETE